MSVNVVNLFQSFRTILCVCPCCGELVRLSDLRLKYKGKAPRTWLDTYDIGLRRIAKLETEFNEKEDEIREAARERGRKRVPKLLCKCIDKNIAQLNYDPYDIKPLLHPVDFTVFNGLNTNQKLNDITFLSKRTRSQPLRKIRNSVKTAVNKGKFDWKIARVSLDGTVSVEQ